MRDHKGSPARRTRARRSVGVRELKTHAARILRQVSEARASYLVTRRGRAIGVILPVEGEDEPVQASEAVDATGAWEAFLRAGRRLERRFAPGTSGVRILSDMRR
jgi:prevent-host-death family protein